MNPIGDKSVCDNCNTPITYDSAKWHHDEGDHWCRTAVPRHSFVALENKLSDMKRQLTDLNRALREKNIALDAMGWVWCNGGCAGGVYRWTPSELTEEIVKAAEINTKRLRTWFDNVEFKRAWNAFPQAERDAMWEQVRKKERDWQEVVAIVKAAYRQSGAPPVVGQR